MGKQALIIIYLLGIGTCLPVLASENQIHLPNQEDIPDSFNGVILLIMATLMPIVGTALKTIAENPGKFAELQRTNRLEQDRLAFQVENKADRIEELRDTIDKLKQTNMRLQKENLNLITEINQSKIKKAEARISIKQVIVYLDLIQNEDNPEQISNLIGASKVVINDIIQD
jgi:TolA-binding protein